MEQTLKTNHVALSKAEEPVALGGLYKGIDDVASNVTYTAGDE